MIGCWQYRLRGAAEEPINSRSRGNPHLGRFALPREASGQRSAQGRHKDAAAVAQRFIDACGAAQREHGIREITRNC